MVSRGIHQQNLTLIINMIEEWGYKHNNGYDSFES